MKILKKITLIILIFTLSCATLKVKKENQVQQIFFKKESLYNLISEKFPKSDSPKLFSQKIPDSKLILDSLICFQKKRALITLAKNVIDFSYDNSTDTLFILFKNKIETSKKFCPEILLEKIIPIKIIAEKGKIAIEGIQKINIYSLNLCGKIYTFKKSKPGFNFNGDFYVFYDDKNFIVYKLNSDIPYLFGKIPTIKCVKFKGNILYVIGDKSKIIADLKNKKFIKNNTTINCSSNSSLNLKDITIFLKNNNLYVRKNKYLFYKSIYFNQKFSSPLAEKVLQNKKYTMYKFKKDNSSICFYFINNQNFK